MIDYIQKHFEPMLGEDVNLLNDPKGLDILAKRFGFDNKAFEGPAPKEHPPETSFQNTIVDYIRHHFGTLLGKDTALLHSPVGLEVLKDKYLRRLQDKSGRTLDRQKVA